MEEKDRVIVEGIHRVWKHVKPSPRNPQGGRIQKDAPIHISNVMPVDPATGKGTRVKFEAREGKKTRVAVEDRDEPGCCNQVETSNGRYQTTGGGHG